MLKEKIKQLENSEIFKRWRNSNKNCHLAHVFILFDELNKNDWQIGYYNPDDHMITTFIVGKEISQNPPEEVFKEEEHIVKELLLSKVKIDAEKALETADKLQKEKYKTQIPFKKIAILQHLDLGQVWNITYVTQSMQTLNIKIDSETGKVKQDHLVSLVEIKK